MPTQSVERDLKSGPDFPLGLIVVASPGTPVNIMSLVDASNVNAPETATSTSSDEYTVRAQQIWVQGMKAAANGLQNNSGNVYLCRKGVQGTGSPHNGDYGTCVLVVPAGQVLFYCTSALVRNGLNPYRYYIDADNTNDSAIVSLILE